MLLEEAKNQNRFLLLYGTATGQAQAIAEEIAEKATSYGLNADLYELDDIGKKFNLEKERCVVIVTSTTGDGDPPPNAEKFMRRIKKRILSSDYLAHMHYALLGLGDSNYSNFCRCGRDMNTRLEALGAQQFYPPGFADDGVGLEVVADPWLRDLYPELQKFLGVEPSNQEPTVECVESKTNSRIKTRVESSKTVQEGIEKLTVSSDGNSGARPSSHEDQVDSVKGYNKTTESVITSVNDTGAVKDESKTVNDTAIESQSHNDRNSSKRELDNDNTSEELLESSTGRDLYDGDENSIIPSSVSHPNLITKELPADVKVTRLANKSLVQCWPETPCEVVTVCESQSQLVSDRSLSEQNLTVPVLPPPYLDVSFKDTTLELTSLPYQNKCKLPSAASDIFYVAVSKAQVLTAPDAVKKTILLCLSLDGTNITYSPGDSLSVICPNSSSEVDLLIQRLQLQELADQAMTVTVLPDTKKRRAAVPAHIHPTQSSLRHVLTSCLNIRDPPSKAMIRTLIEHTKEELEVRRMQELCSKEGSQEYTRYLRQGQISLLDFLSAFPSCSPPVEVLLEHLPRLQPRPYSACSSQVVTPNSLDLVFNLVELKAVMSEGHYYHRRGVCTGWLDDITAQLQEGNQSGQPIKIPVFLRTNQHFRPPSSLSQPLLMIGPGTGVAPFVGFLEERAEARRHFEEKTENKEEDRYAETCLYFGCRNKDKDFLFRDKLESFVASGTLTKLQVTFSRDISICDGKAQQPSEESGDSSSCPTVENGESNPYPTPAPPRYVQDQMRQDSAHIARLLTESEALVYVCGDAQNMAADVALAFEDILQTEKGMNKDEAHMFVMKKRIHKTYLEDVWL